MFPILGEPQRRVVFIFGCKELENSSAFSLFVSFALLNNIALFRCAPLRECRWCLLLLWSSCLSYHSEAFHLGIWLRCLAKELLMLNGSIDQLRNLRMKLIHLVSAVGSATSYKKVLNNLSLLVLAKFIEHMSNFNLRNFRLSMRN